MAERAVNDRIRLAVDQFPTQTTVTLDKADVRALLYVAERAVMVMRAVVSSPVCHSHNAVMLRDAIAHSERVLAGEGDASDDGGNGPN